MTLWWIIAALAMATVIPLLSPLLKPPKTKMARIEYDLEIYRDQLTELEAEENSGAVNPQEIAESRREIERRIIRASDASKSLPDQRHTPSPLMAVGLAMALPAVATLIYASLGSPNVPSHMINKDEAKKSHLDSNTTDPRQADSLDIMIQRLSKRLQKDENDVQGWVLLGRSYWTVGKFLEATKAYSRALELDANNPDLQVAYGRAILAEADGQVTPHARMAFERAYILNKRHIGARYYLAICDFQDGQFRSAYDRWLKIARELPLSSESRQEIITRLEEVADKLQVDLSKDLQTTKDATLEKAAKTSRQTKFPGPTQDDIDNAATMSDDDRQAFIQSMVERLADKMVANPDDFNGWMRLGQAYQVLKNHNKSAAAYGMAAKLRPKTTTPLELQVNSLIKANGTKRPYSSAILAPLRELRKLQPTNKKALWYLGLYDSDMGDNKAALSKWRLLLTQLPATGNERSNLEESISELEKR